MNPKKIIKSIILTIGFKRVYQVFKVIRGLYLTLDFILDNFTGYSLVCGWKSERKNGSGHLVKICGRFNGSPGTSSFPHHFILKHEKYVENPAQFVLKNDHVTLMGVTSTKAWFAVTSTKKDVYALNDQPDQLPFAFMNQFYSPEKLFFVNHEVLHQIAEKMGDLQGNCILINNTGRCGSTLLCQMFAKLPETQVMSEPWGLLYLHRMYNDGKLKWPRYLRLLETCTKLSFKPAHQTQIERYILKLPLLCAAQMSVIKSIFGSKIKLILSTRHPKPSFLSFAKIFAQNDINKVARFFYGNLSLPYDHALKEPFYKTHYNNPNKVNVGQITSLGYAAVIVGYLLKREKYHHVAIYEEMTQNFEEETLKLFDNLDIPVEFVPKALTALNKHSQNKYFGGSELNKEELISETDWQKADDIFEELKVPIRIGMSVNELVEALK